MAIVVTRKPMIVVMAMQQVLSVGILTCDLVCGLLLIFTFPEGAVPAIVRSISVVLLQVGLISIACSNIGISTLGMKHVLNYHRDGALMCFMGDVLMALLAIIFATGQFWIQGSLSRNLSNTYTFKAYNPHAVGKSADSNLHWANHCPEFTGGNQHQLCRNVVIEEATHLININGAVCLTFAVLQLGTILGLLYYLKLQMKKVPWDEADEVYEDEGEAAGEEEAAVEYVEEAVEYEEYVPLTDVMNVEGAMDLSLAYDGMVVVDENHPGYDEWYEQQ